MSLAALMRWMRFLSECGNTESLTATTRSFVNHRFRMIHRTHTSLQLWGGKMVVSTDDHFSHPLTRDTKDYVL